MWPVAISRLDSTLRLGIKRNMLDIELETPLGNVSSHKPAQSGFYSYFRLSVSTVKNFFTDMIDIIIS